MAAFNIVRFRVKPGEADNFIDAHRRLKRPMFKGFSGGWLVRTGDDTFCMVGQWKTFRSIVNARPEMIKMLDQTRAMLEDLGGGLGVTDPISGSAVVRLGAPRRAKERTAAKGKAKPAKKSPAAARKAKPAKKSARKAKRARKMAR